MLVNYALSVAEEIDALGNPPRVISFTLPKPTPLLNKMLRQHWASRRKAMETLAWEIRAAAGPSPVTPFERAHVRVERRSLGTPDADGLAGGMKGLLDVLQPRSKRHPNGLGFIAGDDPERLVFEPVAVRVGLRAEQGTTVVIRELLP